MADKTYEGEDIVVTYNVRRCIHAGECVHGLGAVFDPKRRPWVDPAMAAADQVAEVVMRCPSGALQFQRKDGGIEEITPAKNTITIDPNGPLYLRGQLEVTLADESVHADTRVALCRCGASNNKPFCDNSHLKIEFEADAQLKEVQVKPERDGEEQVLKVMPSRNGPLLVQGPLELIADGEAVRGSQAALCRCGGSQNKPFCDGTHNKNGFSSE